MASFLGENAFSVIRTLCEKGRLKEALEATDLVYQQNANVSSDILYCLLQECIHRKDLAAGRQVHLHVVTSGFGANDFLGSHLIRMFALCGSLLEVNRVFSQLHKPTVFAWAAIILAHIKLGQAKQAVKLYQQMQLSNLNPDQHVLGAVLKACANSGALTQGKLIHGQIIQCGSLSNIILDNILMDMYSKCGSFEEASNLFEKLLNRDVVSWTIIIESCAHHGHGQGALQYFRQMQQEGINPDDTTFVCLLKSCSNVTALNEGKTVHLCIKNTCCGLSIFVGNALIDMYAMCGNMYEACRLFEQLPSRDIITWNAMILGFAKNELVREAFEMFSQMLQEREQPDVVTFVGVLKACARRTFFKQVHLIHSQLIEGSFELDVLLGSTLIDLYAKFGDLEDAQVVFNTLGKRDVVTWTTLISGYAQHGYSQKALQFFGQMQQEGMDADDISCVTILKTCACMVAINQGKLAHAFIIEHRSELDAHVGSSLIDMYVMCGSLDDACRVFGSLSKTNVVTWNSMIAGYAQHGNHKSALQCFEDMQCDGVKPDEVTFLILLSASNHMGMVNAGSFHFSQMTEQYGFTAFHEHYSCIVDILGRAGCLTAAEDLLQTMPFKADALAWTSLLCHCKTFGNVQLGRQCYNHIIAIDCSDATCYEIMSNIFGNADMLVAAGSMQSLRKSAHAWKSPGRAFIEINNKVHDFSVGDKSHVQSNAMYVKLEALGYPLRREGYVPGSDLIQQPSIVR